MLVPQFSHSFAIQILDEECIIGGSNTAAAELRVSWFGFQPKKYNLNTNAAEYKLVKQKVRCDTL